MDYLRNFLLSMLCSTCLVACDCWGAEHPYHEGSVWTVTFVRVKPGMSATYLRDLANNWKKVMDEAHKQQLVLSYKILGGNPVNRDDWDLMLLIELKNWAALDGAEEKFGAIEEKLIGPETRQTEMMLKRGEIRDILGTKNLHEIIFK